MIGNKLLETAVLRIRMLGPFHVSHHQEILTWPTQKSKALLQILLVEPGRLTPTEQILEYLWPDLPPRKAQNNLWVTVSQLRRVLQPDLQPRAHSAYIHKQGEGYRFNPESDHWLDGHTYATHLAAAQTAGDLKARITAWDAARILYQGEYLADEPYAEWAQIPRTQWRRRYEQLLLNLAQAYGQNGRFRQAITHCREILTLDNANETAYRLLMRCHVALGERTTALKVYDEAVQALQDEIGVDPMPETTVLARQIKLPKGEWRLETESWAITSPQSFGSAQNKRSISTPFVGRGDEIDQLTRLLTQAAAGQGQMALNTGEPGIGKSRLVQETAVLARGQGFHVLSAHCYQVEQTIPYQPLIDLARQVMASDDRWQQLAPFWLHELAVLVPDMGELVVDVVFGGLFFVFVDARHLQVELIPDNAAPLDDLGMRILAAANEQVAVRHPELPHLDAIIDLRFYGEPVSEWANSRNVVILGDHMVDRSPCGTGTCAEVALRYARGQLDPGKPYVTESIIGTHFTAQVIAETQVGSDSEVFPAVIPKVTGSAYITGFHQFVLDSDDPFPEGFRLMA